MRHSESLRVRLTPGDAERVAALVVRLPLRAAPLARELLLLGLRAVEADPAVLLRGDAPREEGA